MATENFDTKMKYIVEYGIDFDKNIIQVFGELTEEIGVTLRVKYNLIKEWYKSVKKEELKEITLDISSFGGSIYSIFAALDFYHEVGKEGVLVNTRAHSVCMSAATVLLAGGTGKRTSSPNCRFLLHDLQIDGVGGTAAQVEHATRQIISEQMDMFRLYAQFANRNVEIDEKELNKEAKKWQKTYTKTNTDSYLTPEKMLQIKLIDEIE